MSAGTDHDLKALTERVRIHGDTLADLDSLTVKQSRAIDDLTSWLAELERRIAGPTKRERSAVDDKDNQSTVPKPCDMAAGSTVIDRYGWQWTKQTDTPGMWKAGANVVTDGMLEKVFGPFSAAIEPARRIDSTESLRNLNVGALVRSRNGVVWEKQDDCRWTSDVPLPGRTSGMLWVGHGPVFTLVRE